MKDGSGISDVHWAAEVGGMSRPESDDKEVAMNVPNVIVLARLAVLALAKIKAAAQTFDRGEANAFDTLDAIAVAIDGYRTASCAAREAA